MESENKVTVPTIEGVKKQWEALGDNYSEMDACPQTFFYTISNMLKLDSASKILQIACGTGKLVPMVLDLKNSTAEYYATDISQKMLSLLKLRLEHHFQKYQSKLTLEEWMDKVKLKVKLLNGEQDLHSQIPDEKQEDLKQFDRIIANLVLMLTPDAETMLKNLYDHSKTGCLLGLTVWGNKPDNTLQTIFPQLLKEYGFPEGPASRSNFYLYKKVEEIAKRAGWDLVLNWDQIAFMPFLDVEEFRPYGRLCTERMTHLTAQQQKKLQDGYIDKIREIIESKRPLQFSGQCYIFVKK